DDVGAAAEKAGVSFVSAEGCGRFALYILRDDGKVETFYIRWNPPPPQVVAQIAADTRCPASLLELTAGKDSAGWKVNARGCDREVEYAIDGETARRRAVRNDIWMQHQWLRAETDLQCDHIVVVGALGEHVEQFRAHGCGRTVSYRRNDAGVLERTE